MSKPVKLLRLQSAHKYCTEDYKDMPEESALHAACTRRGLIHSLKQHAQPHTHLGGIGLSCLFHLQNLRQTEASGAKGVSYMPLFFRLLLFCPFCSIHEFRDTPFLIILLARIPPIPVVQPGQTPAADRHCRQTYLRIGIRFLPLRF